MVNDLHVCQLCWQKIRLCSHDVITSLFISFHFSVMLFGKSRPLLRFSIAAGSRKHWTSTWSPLAAAFNAKREFNLHLNLLKDDVVGLLHREENLTHWSLGNVSILMKILFSFVTWFDLLVCFLIFATTFWNSKFARRICHLWYDTERTHFFGKVTAKIRNLHELNDPDKFILLMSSKDKQIVVWTGKFIYKCFNIRSRFYLN